MFAVWEQDQESLQMGSITRQLRVRANAGAGSSLLIEILLLYSIFEQDFKTQSGNRKIQEAHFDRFPMPVGIVLKHGHIAKAVVSTGC